MGSGNFISTATPQRGGVTIQANEVLKKILSIGKSLNGYIFILNLLDLNFRKVKLNKSKTCTCNKWE